MKYDKSDVSDSKVLKAGIGYTFGNYLIKGLTFLTTPIFARLLSTSEYGVYNTYVSYEAIVFVILGLALHTSIKNAKYKFNIEKYISSIIYLIIINLLVTLLVGNIFIAKYSELLCDKRIILNMLLLQAFGSSMIYIYNSYVSLTYSYKRYLILSFVNAFSNILLSIFLVLYVYPSDRHMGRIIGTALPVICLGVFIAIYFLRNTKFYCNLMHWKFGLVYSLPIIPHGISQVILSQFDRIMINIMVGAKETGIYGFSTSVVSIVQITAASLDNVWGPWFYERMARKDVKAINKYSQIYVWFVLVFICLIGLGTPEILYILGGEKYRNSVYTTLPLLMAAFFSFYYSIPSQVEYFLKKTSRIAVATISAALLNITLNYFCVSKFGYIAAAYTTEFTYILYFLFHFSSAKKLCKELYPIKDVIQVLFVAIFLQGIIYVLIPYAIIRWGIILAVAVIFLFNICKIKQVKRRGEL